MESKNMEVWADWEAHFRPFPAECERVGFDRMLELLADRLYEEQTPLGEEFGDVMVCGHFDREMVVSICEPDLRAVVHLRGDEEMVSWQRPGIGQFQETVAKVLAELDMQGNLRVERVITIMRPLAPLAEDDEDDAAEQDA